MLRAAGLRGGADSLWNTQGYDLTIAVDSIVIAAPSVAGRFYGVQTLRQLLRQHGSRLPCLRIHDYPALKWRGVSEDISRGQMPRLAEFRQTLADLAALKINMYHLYIEDVLEFASAPEAGRGRARLRAEDLRALSDEARRHQITLVPIVETVSHQEHLLAMSEFAQYAEAQDVWRRKWNWDSAGEKLWAMLNALLFGPPDPAAIESRTFAVASAETRTFVRGLLRDAAQAAPTGYIHLGADEATDVGTGVGRATADRMGRGALLADYLTEMSVFADQHLDRRPLIYADPLLADPEVMRRVPRDLGVVYWNYGRSNPNPAMRALSAAGFRELFVSSGLWNWKATYPHYWRAFPNIAAMTRAAVEARAAGSIVSSWGDNGAESMGVLNWPGYAFAADAGWSGRDDEPTAFMRRFTSYYFGTRDTSLATVELLLGWQELPSIGWNQRLSYRAPVIRMRTPEWVARMVALERDMARARSLLQRAAPDVRFHHETLPYLEHSVRRFAFAARRELLLDRIARAPGSQDETELRALRDEAAWLADEYVRLWRLRYQPTGMKLTERRMRAQVSGLDALLPTAGTVAASSRPTH